MQPSAENNRVATPQDLPAQEPFAPPPVSGLPAGPGPRSDSHVAEIGGPAGPEPTRYGDWERRGRCIDF
jgi:hypothetical protein